MPRQFPLDADAHPSLRLPNQTLRRVEEAGEGRLLRLIEGDEEGRLRVEGGEREKEREGEGEGGMGEVGTERKRASNCVSIDPIHMVDGHISPTHSPNTQPQHTAGDVP